jgi:branched-chain amino acid transport system ATP-binding protein
VSLLKITGLQAQHGLLKAVRGIDLELNEGERIALIGPNGAGKTTLLRAIAGIHPVAAGQILFDGIDVTGISAYRRAAMGIALVPEGRRLFGSMTVTENLLVAMSARRAGPWNIDTVVDAFPQLKPKLKSVASSLSGGQQQAVAIARALMTNPRALLLDEVSLGLSPAAVQGVYDSLASVVAQRMALILVEQNLDQALSVADRLVCMLEGSVVAHGNKNEMTREEIMAHYFEYHPAGGSNHCGESA